MNKPRLQPQWTYLGYTLEGVPICPYRGAVSVDLDGTRYFANGWNQSWYMDIVAGKLFPLGSTVPTTFAVADAAGGSTFPAGRVVTYYLVFRNSSRQEETAAQIIDHTMSGTKDNDVTWVDPGDGRWDKARIYRRKNLSNDIVKVADVAIATQTYTDSTPDGSLSNSISDVYVPRYRTTLPPPFKALATHRGYMLGITGKDAIVHFSQRVRGDGELVQTDFPDVNKLAIDPDDGLGENVAIFSHNDITIIGKRRGLYVLQGDFADESLTYQRMYAGRGVLSARAILAVQGAFTILDEQGLYAWSPDAVPQIVGTRGGSSTASPLSPLWERIGRAAADMIHLTHREARGVVDVAAPLDHEPIPMRAPIWNYRDNRFDSIDDRVALAAGMLEDGAGVEHECYLNELGHLWEREQSAAGEGVEAGSTSAGTLSAAADVISVLSGAFEDDDLLGPEGSPMQIRDPATAGEGPGALSSDNRVYAAGVAEVTVLYRLTSAVLQSQTLEVGTVPFIAAFAKSDWGTADRKTLPRLIVRFTPQDVVLGTSPYLHVYSSADSDDYTYRPARQSGDGVDQTNPDGWALVPCWDRCFRWNLKFEAFRAPDRVKLQAMTADLWAGRLRR